jgi:hypothetical protein
MVAEARKLADSVAVFPPCTDHTKKRIEHFRFLSPAFTGISKGNIGILCCGAQLRAALQLCSFAYGGREKLKEVDSAADGGSLSHKEARVLHEVFAVLWSFSSAFPAEFQLPSLMSPSPSFGHRTIQWPPNLPIQIGLVVYLRQCCVRRGSTMGTTQDHRRCAEECVAMAQRSDDDSDKALWLTLAQSWVRLAEHVARGPHLTDDTEAPADAASADQD